MSSDVSVCLKFSLSERLGTVPGEGPHVGHSHTSARNSAAENSPEKTELLLHLQHNSYRANFWNHFRPSLISSQAVFGKPGAEYLYLFLHLRLNKDQKVTQLSEKLPQTHMTAKDMRAHLRNKESFYPTLPCNPVPAFSEADQWSQDRLQKVWKHVQALRLPRSAPASPSAVVQLLCSAPPYVPGQCEHPFSGLYWPNLWRGVLNLPT